MILEPFANLFYLRIIILTELALIQRRKIRSSTLFTQLFLPLIRQNTVDLSRQPMLFEILPFASIKPDTANVRAVIQFMLLITLNLILLHDGTSHRAQQSFF